MGIPKKKTCFRNVPSIKDLECTADGEFRYQGKPKSVLYCYVVTGKRATARITIMMQGKSHYWQAAKLVAQTWKADYKDGCSIIYKDGNCHNIKADNLIITDAKGYDIYMRRNSVMKADSLNERKRKLQLVSDQALMTKHYFETLNMSEINNHVKTYLYECLMHYALNTLHMGEKKALETVPEVIGDMYEKIMNGMCLYNYERFCKKVLLDIKKKGKYGEYWHKLVKPIKIEVEQLNLDCLWERYKVTKLRN
jgi:hypothetical protein